MELNNNRVFLIGVFIFGIYWWFDPFQYFDIKNYDRLHLVVSASYLAIPVILITLISSRDPVKFVHWLILSATTAVIVRVIYDTTFVDPTSHNLFPFELMIAAFMVSIISYPVSMIIFYLKKKMKRK